ncbi:cellulase family glycosylhydrolase [Flavobacterium chungbukense]|uniref:Glycoside hydrolase family 5 domain-containing protein n=1 Tax=Flavobacterium chungbukense TaxID=877464 RepID=A0ABP7YDX2_9FLAO|nr:cellulase family glycosylhydrolase [Flavobacterium chungbukense]MCC4920601.1 hypothetical protein [Flavobacterium chungbukense]
MKIQNSIALLCVLLGFSAQSQNSIPIISINPDEVISNEFIGSGIEFSAYPHADTEDSEWGKLMTEEKWQLVFDRVSFIKPKIARVMDQANWRYLKGFDASGNPIIDFESDQMRALYKLLDYCEKNKIAVILGEWGQPYKVHDTHLKLQNSFTGANDPKWIELIVKNLNHLIKVKKYSCIKYYNLVNEPNGDWATTDGDFEQWKEGIQLLHKAIKKAGLDKHISIIGPDATSFNNPKSKYKGLDWARQTALQIPDLVSAYDVHDYPSKESIRSGEFQKTFSELVRFTDSVHKKPFILGELGLKGDPSSKEHLGDKFTSVDSQLSVYDYDYGVDMADALIQSINSGFDAVIAWDLDDAMHTKDDKGDKYKLKRWGMFNSLGKELTDNKADEELRPWFYTWSIMTRYFTGDMKIVKNSNLNIDKVRALTGITKSGDITIAIVNNSDNEANFTIDTKKLKLKSALNKYLYSENKRPVDAKGFPVPLEKITIKNNAIQVSIPAKSVILYTSYQP